ncbi:MULTISPECIES: NADP-dependent phosphogluconate dehydrogenase [Lacticaseibacillus]|uniref:6-phosphogluconate dehydrogenase, decarboxylating n=1 Tax=Lacticaseibacillus casei DSM 20011 = JCM 1134 = ATCC 393 TaxID=1423732 RepID=A0AAD1ARW3_LACCA|nr:NADP-dependent phosphogluconate dehydrogenase [Lacticaseibacillus casei]MBI6598128.1 NADP-dependent phosphogluconate dehydrogenase [Lacticaseibacillus casei]MBO1481811.1 NADP-dependent phosphogluconate dehydrogenase [Lacticaseibacillus casei]MBO2417079.1 NADP-dependent phosphogluconate dehydrogenase [Lacticaseibacillus casei]MCK2081467.1 NADP-dependent phosphogluconate dehydrogenase [Lacticaseibacillus casei]MDZ5496319.1 NADP-dependent phosphogluconate dehydrogenase [Lacticaseibacillus case
MDKPQIGVVGMAVMGKNLALNIESRGNTVAIYNRTGSKTKAVVDEHPDKKLVPSYKIEDFAASLEKPRRIIMMVKAGAGTDAVIKELLPLLDKGDVLIDGGNTFFEDTMRRSAELDKSGINFIGMGVSGGELGALHGPSLMPGGQKEAYDLVAPILEAISAKADDGAPCVTYIGPNGAGHYVKMVHNGIEYGDMELIAESYNLMRNLLDLDVKEIADIFSDWNKGELDSYLIDITADILTRKDDLGSDKPIVDVILDRARNKGTGKWSSQSALELGVPQSVITESVYARYISAMKQERVAASKVLPKPVANVSVDKKEAIEMIRKALYFSKLMSYAQGFEQMRFASEKYDWNLQYGELAKIWRAGCIIRARFLQNITDAYNKKPDLQNLLLDDYFLNIAKNYQESVRDLVGLAVKAGVPVPGFSAAISYYDSYRSPVLPANLTQAQRDYFGAHTYERTDRDGIFHYSWYHEA